MNGRHLSLGDYKFMYRRDYSAIHHYYTQHCTEMLLSVSIAISSHCKQTGGQRGEEGHRNKKINHRHNFVAKRTTQKPTKARKEGLLTATTTETLWRGRDLRARSAPASPKGRFQAGEMILRQKVSVYPPVGMLLTFSHTSAPGCPTPPCLPQILQLAG